MRYLLILTTISLTGCCGYQDSCIKPGQKPYMGEHYTSADNEQSGYGQ